ncbi:MAG: hypothetical protein SGPRY_004611 [Prymnesium sp.]
MGTESEAGLYLLAAQDIFAKLRQPAHAHLSLVASSYEIYGSKVFDLLNNRACLPVREDGRKRINVVGLTQQRVPDVQGFQAMLSLAADARRTAATLVHDTSSRSHAVLQLSICSSRRSGKEEEERGRFSFIDLAGTERGADTLNCVDRDRRIEGAEINKSLLALKECIRGLDQGKTHIPFRGSKLTEVLRDSFIGDCHTVMIGAVSPSIDSTKYRRSHPTLLTYSHKSPPALSSSQVEQTLNTLRYADRVRDFSSAPKLPGAPSERPSHSSDRPSMEKLPPAPLAERPPVDRPSGASAIPQSTPRSRLLTSQSCSQLGRPASKLPSTRITADPSAHPRERAQQQAPATALPAVSASPLVTSSTPKQVGAREGGPPSPLPSLNVESEISGPDAATVEHVQRLLAEEKAERVMAEQLAQLKGDADSSPTPPPRPPPPKSACVPTRRSARTAPPMPTMASSLPTVNSFTPPPPVPLPSPPPSVRPDVVPEGEAPPTQMVTRSSRLKTAMEENKENGERSTKPRAAPAEVRQAVFDSHRQFITSCVEQLEVHTYMLSQASLFRPHNDREAGLHDYVMGLEALLAERQAALGSLQRQLQTFRVSAGT